MNGFGKHLEIVLKEMCSRVGANYDYIDFKKEQWFWDYEWTQEQETNFKRWLTDYLCNNKEARKELVLLSSNKDNILKAATFFVMNYGWKLKREENDS
jgi:hypothetical protein